MKDVLIIAHYTSIPTVNALGRFNVVATKLCEAGFTTELVTSSFEHSTRMQLKELETEIDRLPYRVTLINEPGYKTNISIRRIISHKKMSLNLRDYLEKRNKPTLVYCSIPSISVANEAAKYCKRNGVKLIVDIQDLWPEAINMVFPFGKLNSILTYPLKRKADFVYKSADTLIAVSETYKNRALCVENKKIKSYVVYLGTDLERYEKALINYSKHENNKKNRNKTIVGYCGTLGHSYDINCVIEAISLLKNKYDMEFYIMGDGPLRKQFENYAQKRKIAAKFTGMLPFEEMVGELMECDIVVNPITKNAAQSIINKHATYAMSGLPVLNTQECKEYIDLIRNEDMGLNSPASDAVALSKNLETLILDPDLRHRQGENGRRFAHKVFDRRITYNEIVNIVKECIDKND